MLERGVDMKLIPVEKVSAEASVSSCAVTNQKSHTPVPLYRHTLPLLMTLN